MDREPHAAAETDVAAAEISDATLRRLSALRARLERGEAERGAGAPPAAQAEARPRRAEEIPALDEAFSRFEIELPADPDGPRDLAETVGTVGPWATAVLAALALLASAGSVGDPSEPGAAPIESVAAAPVGSSGDEDFYADIAATGLESARVAAGDFATASIASSPAAAQELMRDEDLRFAAATTGPDGYLDASTLSALIGRRPVKCVVAAPLPSFGAAGIDREALRLAASVAADCVETVTYNAEAALMRRRAPAPNGGAIEVNAAFSIEADALCHHTRGLSALVIGGDLPAERARSLESLLDASYAALGGAPICYRLQPLGLGPDGPVFRADAYVDGRRSAERTDPRPFVMKPRSLRPTL